jgi:hypothetical protein
VKTSQPLPTPPRPPTSTPASHLSTSQQRDTSSFHTSSSSSVLSDPSRSITISTSAAPGGENTATTSLPSNPKAQDGLSTGTKAGIGVGASIAALLLALGAFFLGISIHKKSKKTANIETAPHEGKPELDGKSLHHTEAGIAPNTRHELHTEAGIAPNTRHELHTEAGIAPNTRHELHTSAMAPQELHAPYNPVEAPFHAELHVNPRGTELDGLSVRQPPYELHADGSLAPSSSYIPYNETARQDDVAHNVPRLVQSPWTHGDAGRR